MCIWKRRKTKTKRHYLFIAATEKQTGGKTTFIHTDTHKQTEERANIPAVEVFNSLRRLEGRIRVPDLASLRQDGLARLRVSGIGGNTLLDQARLNGYDAHGDSTQLGAAWEGGRWGRREGRREVQ